MKSRTYQQIALTLIIALGISFLFSSCVKNKKNIQKEDIVVTHEFPNGNWAFEEEVLDLGFDITDTIHAYRIEFSLNYDSTANTIDELPVTITLTGPDGMETFVSSKFNFDPKVNKDITPTGQGSICNMNLIAFPKKNLNQVGHYNINFYRKATKADNYGLNSLTMRVVPVKK
ncbi:MAG: hypothetical protein MJZ57_06220 [Bacteroidales bacterium]|nr:hypothetical protein [Bacteroidales bacterium]